MPIEACCGELAISHPGTGRRPCALIRGGNILPEPYLQKNVRRHVQRMLRVGSDLGVRTREGQSALGAAGIVVGVDQIVRGARMICVGCKDSLSMIDRVVYLRASRVTRPLSRQSE